MTKAIGDVIERPDTRFTHMSGTMAGMAVQNALFPDKGLPVNAPSSKLSEARNSRYCAPFHRLL